MSTPHDVHASVLRDRCVELLACGREGELTFVDATCGMGGHTEAVLENYPQSRVFGIDRDPHARAIAAQRLQRFGDRFIPCAGVFDDMAELLAEHQVSSVDGVLMDLGASSLQLDDDDRGFSYSRPAPLDMRMNPEDDLTAADVLNTYPESEIARILFQYGDEKFSRQIAKRVVAVRDESPLKTSDDLMAILDRAIPAASRRKGGHPGKRTFQALRIEVNDELGAIGRALPIAADLLGVGGVLVVMSFQSLEDRMVKRFLAQQTTADVPPDMPIIPEAAQPDFELLTRGAEKAGAEEIELNPRAASVRLRAARRICVARPRSRS